MSRYTWIVFDADGTLFDYDRAEIQALTTTFGRSGLMFDSDVHARFSEINAGLWQAFERGEVSSERLRVQRFEALAETCGFTYDAADFSRDYLSVLGAQLQLIDDAEIVVRTLSGTHRLALATNGIADVQRSRVAKSDIGPLFEAVAISDEMGVAKPAAGFFEGLFRKLGEPDTAEVLMVGDGLSSDIRGGIDFGIDTCWFNPSGAPNPDGVTPTYEIRSLTEILGIVGLSES